MLVPGRVGKKTNQPPRSFIFGLTEWISKSSSWLEEAWTIWGLGLSRATVEVFLIQKKHPFSPGKKNRGFNSTEFLTKNIPNSNSNNLDEASQKNPAKSELQKSWYLKQPTSFLVLHIPPEKLRPPSPSPWRAKDCVARHLQAPLPTVVTSVIGFLRGGGGSPNLP